MASTVIGRVDSFSTSSGRSAGEIRLTRVAPAFNASSNAYRYYIMRNRGHMKHYFKTHGEYKPVRFALGSALTFSKELLRLTVVERTIRGTSNLRRGVKDGRTLARDASWQPMPPLA